MNITSYRFAVPLGLALTLALPARADDQPSSTPGGGAGLGLLGSPEVTLRAGVVLPVFLIYELPGPMLGLTLAWPRSEPLQVIARAELGALFFDGAQRYLGNLGVGARLTPWRDWSVSPWLQLGLGTLGHVEHISVVLPERVVSDTDVGVSFSVDAAIGVRFAERWELGFAWNHTVWPLPYYEVYTGAESLPYRGTALTWIGVDL